jgi:hypothetical protein
MMERRWHARAPIAMDVALYYDGLGMLRCRTRDVSLEGMFIKTGAIALPFHVPIDIVIPETTDAAPGRVMHRLPAYVVRVANDGVGTMFRNLDIRAFRALQRLLRSEDVIVPPRGEHASESSLI